MARAALCIHRERLAVCSVHRPRRRVCTYAYACTVCITFAVRWTASMLSRARLVDWLADQRSLPANAAVVSTVRLGLLGRETGQLEPKLCYRRVGPAVDTTESWKTWVRVQDSWADTSAHAAVVTYCAIKCKTSRSVSRCLFFLRSSRKSSPLFRLFSLSLAFRVHGDA